MAFLVAYFVISPILDMLVPSVKLAENGINYGMMITIHSITTKALNDSYAIRLSISNAKANTKPSRLLSEELKQKKK